MAAHIVLHLPAAAAAEAMGEALARTLPATLADAAVVHLRGDLGTGKTTSARALLRALGVTGTVRSPTYTLVETYPSGNLTCVHADFYRLGSAAEAAELGLRELLQPQHLLLIEWPENGGSAAPAADIDLHLHYTGEARSARLSACSLLGRVWLDEFARDTRLTPYLSNLT